MAQLEREGEVIERRLVVEVARAARDEVIPVLTKSFQNAVNQTFAAIGAAVAASLVDGPDGARQQKLDELRGLADASWTPDRSVWISALGNPKVSSG